MWGLTDYQARTYIRSLKKNQADARKRISHYHLKRADLQIRTGEGIFENEPQDIPCRIVLNDILPSGALIFSSENLCVGQSVALTLQEPRQFYVKGKVVSCVYYALKHNIITSQRFDYRVAIEFRFNTPAERNRVMDYCRLLKERELSVPRQRR